MDCFIILWVRCQCDNCFTNKEMKAWEVVSRAGVRPLLTSIHWAFAAARGGWGKSVLRKEDPDALT